MCNQTRHSFIGCNLAIFGVQLYLSCYNVMDVLLLFIAKVWIMVSGSNYWKQRKCQWERINFHWGKPISPSQPFLTRQATLETLILQKREIRMMYFAEKHYRTLSCNSSITCYQHLSLLVCVNFNARQSFIHALHYQLPPECFTLNAPSFDLRQRYQVTWQIYQENI